MPTKPARRISDFVNEASVLPEVDAAENHVNEDLELIDFNISKTHNPGYNNNNRPYMILSVTKPGVETPFKIGTGAEMIIKQLNQIPKADALPMQIRIVYHEQTRRLKLI